MYKEWMYASLQKSSGHLLEQIGHLQTDLLGIEVLRHSRLFELLEFIS
jgi:hypothetical protein